MKREEIEVVFARGADAVALVRGLKERIDELERRTDRNSGNSSMPPSSDPPKSRAERRREARAKLKELSGRKPGGQPGHEGKHREMAGPERVDRRSGHLPAGCGCGHRFDGTEERVGDPLIHQQWELPPIRPLIFQYELYRLRCPCCGEPRLAELPGGVTWSAFAPRLEAQIATLAGVFRLSRRQARQIVEEVFGPSRATKACAWRSLRSASAISPAQRAACTSGRTSACTVATQTNSRPGGIWRSEGL